MLLETHIRHTNVPQDMTIQVGLVNVKTPIVETKDLVSVDFMVDRLRVGHHAPSVEQSKVDVGVGGGEGRTGHDGHRIARYGDRG